MENKFIIDIDSRTIGIPDLFLNGGVISDHNAMKIYFEAERNYEGEDLSTHNIAIQYVNAGGEKDIFIVTDIDLSVTDKINFVWEISNHVTKYSGEVSFSVKFYSSENNTYTYNYNTKPAKLNILDGIVVGIGEVYVKPDILTVIPTKLSQLTNDANFIAVETDPTVPAWAKEPVKPTYVATEVGALPNTTTIPTKISDLTDDGNFVHKTGDETIGGIKTFTGDISAPNIVSKNEFNTTVGDINSKLNHISNKKYMHLSIDDVGAIFTDLLTNSSTYTSIFENSLLLYYKNLHDTYGVVISLFCYLDILVSTYTGLATYLNEFKDNSNWLKFGLHASTSTTNYSTESSINSESDWNKFVKYIYTITGTYDSIDRIPRLHNYAGNLNACLGFRDGNIGALGFLTADDARDSYYLSSLYENSVQNKNYEFALESGGIASDGTLSANATRLRTTVTLSLLAGTRVSFSTIGAYMLSYTEYSNIGSSTSIGQVSYQNDYLTIPHDGYYKISIRSVAGTDDLSGIINSISSLMSILRSEIVLNKNTRNYEFALESGGIASDGTLSANATRLRTTTKLYLTTGAKIQCSIDGLYMLSYTKYSSDGTFVEQSSYVLTPIVIQSNGYYIISIRTPLGTDDLSTATSGVKQMISISSSANAYVYNHGKYIDSINQLTFLNTDLRIENISDIETTLSELGDVNFINKIFSLIIFTHEWQLGNESIKSKLESCLQYAIENNYVFDYPMYRV